ncbi:PRAME family member 25-like [Cavia porcellus]|uniref:PRAME family member 25-like n=1 Tax=Cavia porcellus TaxID=10141 RepID=UPI000661C849|nr:PRAME family member 25-like [Cavia porcellus]
MSTQFPHRLQKLAIQSLLTDKDLAIWAVEDLPGELFPPVFMEAFTRGHAELLKAMVLSWPFPYLPLGALINIWKARKLNTQVDVDQVQNRMLQAVLVGLDVLLSQKLGSRRLKLQVLDMRDMHQDFWKVWAENQLEACSSEVRRKTKTEKTLPRVAKKQPLKVMLDLWLKKTEQMISQITSQFMKLHCLQEVYVDSLFFLEGHLDQVLRCLICPLETLRLSYCQLLDSDWNQLPHCPSVRHLKHLALYGLDLTHKLDSLRYLLENIAATLTTLHLQVCGIMEAEFLDFLPALSHCSQLTTFSYVRNSMSLATLESLLCHTARLSNLTLEMYSPPEEVYNPWDYVHPLRLNHMWKLQVLDLRDMHQDFWIVGLRAMARTWTPDNEHRDQKVDDHMVKELSLVSGPEPRHQLLSNQDNYAQPGDGSLAGFSKMRLFNDLGYGTVYRKS